jgi:uncharacterized protein (TIGR02246 family)
VRRTFLLAPAILAATPATAASPAGPVPLIPLPRLLTAADYPAEAIRLGQQGNVGMRLRVGAHGRVEGCAITASSGSAHLDSASCRVIVRRARFRPARDSAGRPVAGAFDQVIAWRMQPVPTPAAQAADPPLSPADRAEIESIFTRWEKAWADGDAIAWASLFHEDGTWVLWTGGEWRGRAQMAAEFAGPFATVYKDSVQRIRPIELRRLAPDIAVARILSTTTGDTRQPGVTIYGNKILVLTRRDGRWGILYGQNTRLSEAEAAKLNQPS